MFTNTNCLIHCYSTTKFSKNVLKLKIKIIFVKNTLIILLTINTVKIYYEH